jgi:hypothetical protein
MIMNHHHVNQPLRKNQKNKKRPPLVGGLFEKEKSAEGALRKLS